ncbi:branched-chain amino acid ABC transporter permease [Thermogemmata fonticola]|jgi:branched-chain amino acid transport system permease protein|uniref:Branched-chain amino acid ABC transporter permease n=1 Tax=Thermogemmata fonticola TaxID=2755323 RepID=A0A7V9AAE1_9BACT|nr:branched-chain amino acid ABC transporter permease [Thermogemmata fonticola]MBA2224958.1 branched-chain amino acid ABC transporter permease [Thermogemmata fonticola]
MKLLRHWVLILFGLLAVYPWLPVSSANRGEQFTILFIYAILAQGLNVVLGLTGLLHLGIAAFFGIGAYTVGILTVGFFPFQQSFLVAAAAAVLMAALVGVLTTAPILRLRGDYLALVTLGLGLIVLYAIRNLDPITEGTKGISPIDAGPVPGWSGKNLHSWRLKSDWGLHWYNYPYFYYLCLLLLGGVLLLVRNLEHSRLGRAWVALREDELAATCMGLNPARLKLAAIAVGAGLGGLAGALYAMALRTTGNPQTYDFTLSMLMICCVILGGMGNRNGVLLGTFLLIGFDRILTGILDNQIQALVGSASPYLKLSGWRLIIFGLVLILMMRFRPEGLLPAKRIQVELHPEIGEALGQAAAEAEVAQKDSSVPVSPAPLRPPGPAS